MKFQTTNSFVAFIITIIFGISLLPFISLAAIVNCGGQGQKPCTLNDFLGLISKITNILILNIMPPVATLLLIIGGVIYIFAGGSPELKSLGKKILISTIVGLFIGFGSLAIIRIILTSLGYIYQLP